jgi:double-stranded uracil-DNA glycosylase
MAPVCRSDARLLILGSLPGERSLSRQQYYAHPQNQFWTLLGHVIGINLNALVYDQRLLALKDSKIALWDVIAQATRMGSPDANLRHVNRNDLTYFITRLPQLRAVAFNGALAAKNGKNMLHSNSMIVQVMLPSSSAAYTLPLLEKVQQWQQLKTYLNP